MKKENYRNYQFTSDTTLRRKPDGAAALKHTSDVFVPPHLAHDPLDDLYGNRREAERRQQLQEEETRRRKRRIKREKIKKKRKQKRKGRLTAVGAVLFVLLLWVFLRFAAVPFGTLVIQGNETLTTDDVYRAGGIPGYVNVVQLSPDELKDRLEKDLRISSAVVERQFPATIQVTLTERKAAAIVMTMYGFAYVDKDGVVIELEPQIQGVSVPIMTGKKVDTLLLGDTNQGYYEQCVAMPDMAYGKAGEQPSDLRDSRVSDLIATYEELFHVQRDERITHYFGDYGSHFFNMGVTDQEIQPVYEKALAVMEMDDAGFRSTKEFLHRGEIIGRMRDCLLAKELHPGEEVLFVGTEPYGGPGDFELRGGHIRFVDPERKTCTVRGSFFDMKDVPLRYVLGRYNAEITETHYGRPHVEVLFGEYPALAQQYLHEAEERWEQYETDAAAAPTQTM